ncbi:MAG: hypothetical protein WDN29_03545 [Methylovirgula sp.]
MISDLRRAARPQQPCARGCGYANLAVGPQYVTTHVYVAPRDIDRFVESFVATFGGTATKKQLVNVTPTAKHNGMASGFLTRRRPIRLRFHDALSLALRCRAQWLSRLRF